MQLETLLCEDIKRERNYLREQEVGSEEYNDSLKRLSGLEDKLFDLKKLESETIARERELNEEKKDKRNKNIIEGVKIACGVIIPVVGLIGITAQEKEITFCGALKDYVKFFIPKKTI